MKNNVTLVIMAAGMGSRFGGLKQIEPVGMNGEFIIDYSIYDAKRVGFNKVVFIIKEENYDLFKDTVGKRIEKYIDVEYVFQSNYLLPEEIKSNRVKPLGTAHAIYCTKDAVKENFAVINADDFYGYDAFKVIKEFLDNNSDNEYALVAYNVINTITENGSVKRGICETENGYLTSIIESSVAKENNKLIASPINGDTPFEVRPDKMVSMNFFGFTPSIFNYLESDLEKFIATRDLLKDEYLLPEEVCNRIISNDIKVKALNTNAVWYGMTYKEDKEELMNKLKELVDKGEYPSKLWD